MKLEKVNEFNGFKSGDTLTVNGDIINIGGYLIMAKGTKVVIDHFEITPAFYSARSWMDIPARLNGIKLVGQSGYYASSTFEEQQSLTTTFSNPA